MAEDLDFKKTLPRSTTPDMDGADLTIQAVEGECVRISDGERSALYHQLAGKPLDLTAIKIVPQYVEAGYFSEANCVTLSDGKRQALFVPVRRRLSDP